jgi:hypothetical protein
MDKKTFRLVKVTWIDATSSDPWTDLDGVLEYPPHEISSVGYLVSRTKEKIVLAANLDHVSNDVSCCMIIPKGCIKKIEDL